jgi:hypothetical protein
MPRQARLDAPGTLHHVMIRGIERSPIFKDDQDRKDFISRMGMLAQETGTKIVACRKRRGSALDTGQSLSVYLFLFVLRPCIS